MIRTSGKNNYLLTVFPRPVYNPVSFVENFISVIGKSAEGFLNRNFYLRFLTPYPVRTSVITDTTFFHGLDQDMDE